MILDVRGISLLVILLLQHAFLCQAAPPLFPSRRSVSIAQVSKNLTEIKHMISSIELPSNQSVTGKNP